MVAEFKSIFDLLELSQLNYAALVGKSASIYKRCDGVIVDEQFRKEYVKAVAKYIANRTYKKSKIT